MRILLLPILGAVLLLPPLSARAALMPGDLNGDGTITPDDDRFFAQIYGSESGDHDFYPPADLNADGVIDYRDLALLGSSNGLGGGEVDTTPPQLLVTLNDVSESLSDLLVVPPEMFQITLIVEHDGESLIDWSSLSVTASEDMGAANPAGVELATHFGPDFMRAVWELPVGSELARTSHYLDVSVRDGAGNESTAQYGFAVRDFPLTGAPMESQQIIFLDFGQDRSMGPEVDLLEDLRTFYLSSTASPAIESLAQAWVIDEVVAHANDFYRRNVGGSGEDVANVLFVSTPPAQGSYSRLCVGGESLAGSSFLGNVPLDLNNQKEASDECIYGAYFGVFPQAINDLWGSDPEYHAFFDPFDPYLGGVPIGEHPVDATVMDPGFFLFTGGPAERDRFLTVHGGITTFARIIGVAVAHETGHLLGLVAHGPAPGGLYGGSTGGVTDHNVGTNGSTPSGNFMMNSGASFSFAEINGTNGGQPSFRPLNWAYLRDRLIIDSRVTELLPAPLLDSVNPVSITFGGGVEQAVITLHGENLGTASAINLLAPGDPTPNPVLGLTVVNDQTLTGIVYQLLVPNDLYDVEVTNSDGQVVTLPGALLVQ
jgi:hypothetical protein